MNRVLTSHNKKEQKKSSLAFSLSLLSSLYLVSLLCAVKMKEAVQKITVVRRFSLSLLVYYTSDDGDSFT